MSCISINNALFKLNQFRFLDVPYFQIKQGDFSVVVGSNGSGKTAFAVALEGKLPLYRGIYEKGFNVIHSLSFEKQQRILEQTFKERNNDLLDPDDFGKTARQTILNGSDKKALCAEYAKRLKIEYVLDRPFWHLSTGESRKVLLAQALVGEPELLILDEPFEGLDKKSVADWLTLLQQLKGKIALILIINRLSDIPPIADYISLLDNNRLIFQEKYKEVQKHDLFRQLQHAEQSVDIPLPESMVKPIVLDPFQNPFELENVTIRYGDKKILNNITWTVEPKQHWWIRGPNGAGKSTLLSVIIGEHPQSYSNTVRLFGKQRGSGETVWDIKRNIGYVSSQLHMDYRVNCSVLDVILSGFFDSIGVYQNIPDRLKIEAQQWLSRLNMEKLAKQPFRSLSWGQQRLLLIARAMVKHPPVLILDEPLQGLDGMNRKLVKSFIEQLVNNSNTQMLFVSHQDSDAPDCITHILEFIAQDGGYSYIQSAV